MKSIIVPLLSRSHMEDALKLKGNEKERLGYGFSWMSGKIPYAQHSSFRSKDGGRVPKVAYNSVGGISLANNSDFLNSSNLAQDIIGSNYTSVRDEVTFNALKDSDILDVELNPDVVNLVSECCSEEVSIGRDIVAPLRNGITGKYVVFQATESFISINGVDNIANALSRLVEEMHYEIILQPAGIASWHDSFESLESLIPAIEDKGTSPDKIHVQSNRNIWAQVATIADSACFIGTSLHGRIVATSFAIPRVGLENKKVETYANTWEKGLQPVGVKIENLVDEVFVATSVDKLVLEKHTSTIKTQARMAFGRLRTSLEIEDVTVVGDSTREKISELKSTATFHELDVVRGFSIDLACELSKFRKDSRSIFKKVYEHLYAMLTRR